MSDIPGHLGMIDKIANGAAVDEQPDRSQIVARFADKGVNLLLAAKIAR